MIYTDAATAAPAFIAAITPAHRILLLTHVNPDGDAIGSMLGLWHVLHSMGKHVHALASSPIPSYTMTLPGIDHVQVYTPGISLPDVDLIWLLDTATLSRVGLVYEHHAAYLAARPLLIVDHHVTNTGEGSLNLITSNAASTADLLYCLLRAMQAPILPDAATCFLLGLTTDTQSFQTNSTDAQTLRIAAELLEAGADKHLVVQSVYYAVPYTTLLLEGMALKQLQRDADLLWVVVSQAMLKATQAEEEANDAIINHMRRVKGMRACVLFKERADGTVKISLRSKPGIDVAAVAQQWGGGGHTLAAGATLQMNLSEAQRVVLPVIRAVLDRKD